MGTQKTKEQLMNEYGRVVDSYESILANKKVINKELQNFVVGSQIGEDTYGTVSSLKSVDISLPGKASDFTSVMGKIKSDIDDIDYLMNRNQNLYNDLSYSPIGDPQLSNAFSEVSYLRGTLRTMKSNREGVLKDLDDTLKAVESRGALRAEEQFERTSGQATDKASRGDYTPMLDFSSLSSGKNINQNKQNLKQHEADTSAVLAKLIINGKPIGSGVYDVGAGGSGSDIGMDFVTLQLALDYVNADVEATQLFITDMKDKIDENNNKIELIEAKMKETITVTIYDSQGKEMGQETRPAHDNAALQAQIDKIKEENEILTEDIKLYREKLKQKKEVLADLFRVRNAYNKVTDGMIDLFTADAFVQAMRESIDDGTPLLSGVAIPLADQAALFQNLQLRLEEKQEEYTKLLGDADASSYASVLQNCKTLADGLSAYASLNANRTSDFDSSKLYTDLTGEEAVEYYMDLVAFYEGRIAELTNQYNETLGKQKTSQILLMNPVPFMQDFNDANLQDAKALAVQVKDYEEALAVLTHFKNMAFEKAFISITEADDYLSESDFKIASAEWHNVATMNSDGSINPYQSDVDGTFIFRNQNGKIIIPSDIEIAMYFSRLGEKIDGIDYKAYVADMNDHLSYRNSTPGYYVDGQFLPHDPYTNPYHSSDINKYIDMFKHLTEEDYAMATYLAHTNRTDLLEQFVESRREISVQNAGYEEFEKIKKTIESYYPDGHVLEGLTEEELAAVDSNINGGWFTRKQEITTANEKTLLYLDGIGFVDGLKTFGDGFINLFVADGELSPNDYKTMYLLNYLEEKYNDDVLMKILSTEGYKFSNTMGNMAPSLVVGTVFNPLVGAATLGLSAGGNARERGLQLGMENKEAWVYGALSGLSEAGLQYVMGGVSKLGNGAFSKTMEGFIKSPLLRNMISEGAEESLQEILDPAFIAFSSKGRIIEDVDWGQVAESGIMGMLAAGLIGGGDILYKKARYHINNTNADFSKYSNRTDLTVQEQIDEMVKDGVLSKFDATVDAISGKLTTETNIDYNGLTGDLNVDFGKIQDAYNHGEISKDQYDAAKSIYRGMLKKIHPDLNVPSGETTAPVDPISDVKADPADVDNLLHDIDTYASQDEEIAGMKDFIDQMGEHPENYPGAIKIMQERLNTIKSEKGLDVPSKGDIDMDSMMEPDASPSIEDGTDTGLGDAASDVAGKPSVDLGSDIDPRFNPDRTGLKPKPGNGPQAMTDTGTGTPGLGDAASDVAGKPSVDLDSDIDPRFNPDRTGLKPKPGNGPRAMTDTGTGTPWNQHQDSYQPQLQPEENSSGEGLPFKEPEEIPKSLRDLLNRSTLPQETGLAVIPDSGTGTPAAPAGNSSGLNTIPGGTDAVTSVGDAASDVIGKTSPDIELNTDPRLDPGKMIFKPRPGNKPINAETDTGTGTPSTSALEDAASDVAGKTDLDTSARPEPFTAEDQRREQLELRRLREETNSETTIKPSISPKPEPFTAEDQRREQLELRRLQEETNSETAIKPSISPKPEPFTAEDQRREQLELRKLQEETEPKPLPVPINSELPKPTVPLVQPTVPPQPDIPSPSIVPVRPTVPPVPPEPPVVPVEPTIPPQPDPPRPRIVPPKIPPLPPGPTIPEPVIPPVPPTTEPPVQPLPPVTEPVGPTVPHPTIPPTIEPTIPEPVVPPSTILPDGPNIPEYVPIPYTGVTKKNIGGELLATGVGVGIGVGGLLLERLGEEKEEEDEDEDKE